MSATIELREIDDVPGDARVCHYDELAPPAKERLVAFVDGDAPTVERDAAGGLDRYDVVKYTDYYEVVVR